ncbi:MAG: arginase family protein [archaeon]
MIFKVPFSAGGLGRSKGSELAPDRILEVLKKHRDHINAHDVPVDNSNIEDTNAQIIRSLSFDAKPALIIGGDHSITYASFLAFSKAFENPGLVVFDAHPDAENNFSPPTHEDYLRVLVEEGHLNPQNVILVGVRTWHKNESDFFRKKKNQILYS